MVMGGDINPAPTNDDKHDDADFESPRDLPEGAAKQITDWNNHLTVQTNDSLAGLGSSLTINSRPDELPCQQELNFALHPVTKSPKAGFALSSNHAQNQSTNLDCAVPWMCN